MSETCPHPPPSPGLVAPPRQATVTLGSLCPAPPPPPAPAAPAPPPSGFSGVFKSGSTVPAAKASPKQEAAQSGGGLKHVYFDFDQTISKIHVFKQLAGWEPGVDARHALSERGQIHRLEMLNAAQYAYQGSTGTVVPCAAGTQGASWTACALGGLLAYGAARGLFRCSAAC